MLAWELYLQQETSDKSLELLHLVANECYQAGFFLAAARAFDVLEQLDPSTEYWQAKQGACAGTLQMVAAGKESPDALRCMTCYVFVSMLCCAMLCYAMLCYAMLCYAVLCYAMLCYAMQG